MAVAFAFVGGCHARKGVALGMENEEATRPFWSFGRDVPKSII